MANDHRGMSRRIQILEYDMHMMADVICDLICMMPNDTEWFNERLQSMHRRIRDIIDGEPHKSVAQSFKDYKQQNPTSINTNEVSPLGEQNVSRLL